VVRASAPSTATLLALVVAEEASKTANYIQVMHAYFLGFYWPWDGHYKSILLPADEEIMGSL
jgi:hypothetical protein